MRNLDLLSISPGVNASAVILREYVDLVGNVLMLVRNRSAYSAGMRVLVGSRLQGAALVGEDIGDGDGSTKTFSLQSANKRIVPGTVDITITVAASPVHITDDNSNAPEQMNGVLYDDSDNRVGTVDYAAGTIEVTFVTAPDNTTDILLDYQHGVGSTKQSNEIMGPFSVKPGEKVQVYGTGVSGISQVELEVFRNANVIN